MFCSFFFQSVLGYVWLDYRVNQKKGDKKDNSTFLSDLISVSSLINFDQKIVAPQDFLEFFEDHEFLWCPSVYFSFDTEILQWVHIAPIIKYYLDLLHSIMSSMRLFVRVWECSVTPVQNCVWISVF